MTLPGSPRKKEVPVDPRPRHLQIQPVTEIHYSDGNKVGVEWRGWGNGLFGLVGRPAISREEGQRFIDNLYRPLSEWRIG